MPLKISVITGNPVWDTLPVAKITQYPMESADFKPFAQVRACVSDGALVLRMWAFETTRRPESFLQASFSLPGSDSRIDLRVTADGTLWAECAGGSAPAPLPGVQHSVFEGEDLEGIYWGVLITLPAETLSTVPGTRKLTAGDCLQGNFYKGCTSPDFSHLGCYAPAEPPVEDLFDSRLFVPFSLVNY